MGWLNLFSSESRKKRQAAEDVGLASGLFQRCDVCRELTENQAPETALHDAGQLAERWIADADARVAIYQGDAEELKRQIADIKRGAPHSCLCERMG